MLVFLTASLVVVHLVSKIRTSNTILRYVLEAAADGFWDWDIKRGTVWFSPRWISSLGYDPHEVPGRVESWQRLLHPEDTEKTMAELRAHFEGKTKVYEVENRLLMKSGAWRSNLDRGIVVQWDAKGKPCRMVGFDIDISDRKRAEEESSRRKTAEAVSRAKDDFISLVSHELRNPLSIISMSVKALRRKRQDQAGFEFVLRAIERSVKQQQLLVNDLLDWCRMGRGKFRLNCKWTSLHTVVEGAWSAVAADAESKKITRELAIEGGLENIFVDTLRITQVLWNLFANAVKFTPQGGKIVIRVHHNQGLIIEVEDTGIGISSADLPHLFESHFQVDSADGQRQGGLGLGLSIAREIIERHGGTIRAKSEGVGKGATFTINLASALPEEAKVANG